MVEWRKSVGAQMMLDNPNYDPNYKKPPPRKRPKAELGKVTVSSFEEKWRHFPEDALDANPDTRWAAIDGSVPQWWQLEFVQPKKLKGIEIYWRGQTWRSYQVETSMDGKKWDVVADQKGSRKVRIESKHSFDAEAKFLRVTVDGKGKDWVSFTELVPLFK